MSQIESGIARDIEPSLGPAMKRDRADAISVAPASPLRWMGIASPTVYAVSTRPRRRTQAQLPGDDRVTRTGRTPCTLTIADRIAQDEGRVLAASCARPRLVGRKGALRSLGRSSGDGRASRVLPARGLYLFISRSHLHGSDAIASLAASPGASG